jgi:hypothetical protein
MSIINIINHLEEKQKQRLAELKKDKISRLAALGKQWEIRFSETRSKILDEYRQKSAQDLAQLNFQQKEIWQRETLQKKQNSMDELLEETWKELMEMSAKEYENLLLKTFA